MLHSPRAFHFFCCALYSLLCVAWSARIGPQFLWDYLHYHLYVAHAWAEGRLPAELFAADAQSYLNPLPHLPFYGIWRATQNSLLGTMWMAFLHSANLWLLHFLTCQLVMPRGRLNRLMVVSAVLLGALSPGFLFELGTSSVDVIVSIPALAALWMVLAWQGQGADLGDWRLFLAGICAGLSLGLKPSSLIFCAVLAMVLLALLPGRKLGAVCWRILASGLLGTLAAGGGHAWMLWQSFENPFFPLFNGIFLSPWFHPASLASERFLPTSFTDMLLFPLSMADSARRSGFESVAVDIRPVWLLGLGLAAGLCLVAAWVRGRGRRPEILPAREKLLWLFLLLFFPAWIYSSGNIRYAIPPLLLLGPAIALLALKVGRNKAPLAMLAVLLPLVAQFAPATGLNTPNLLGYKTAAWGRPWFDMEIPAPLDSAPAYYLSLQLQSYASLAPLFPPGSRFFNLIGASALGPDSRVFKGVEASREKLALPFRTLYSLTEDPALKTAGSELILAGQDTLLAEFGYRIDRHDCHLLKSREGDIHLISCGVLKAPPLALEERDKRKAIDARFARWEEKCPRIFAASGFSSIQGLEARRRFYPATDFQMLALHDGRLAALDLFNKTRPSILLEDADGRTVATGCPSRIPFSHDWQP